ncbi:penicillin acylase family protein [Paralimibaculum aggregatum]|uniref:Penicillin acylase family protein n=1 Tax=Paralimibaculum aggregatum TaxID=3036245 RepID=A0ABQ6LRD0_9RHOB|nr:penicillin acylase family protein [Limibaculum sp. NKW23]GMG83590.1 penicillin acylase family protein [Limibaculum sp. NKW23]
MNRILRWMLRGVLAVAGLAAAALGLAWVLVAGSLPDYDAHVQAAGLGAPARVIRDANAIPHIRAGSPADAWYALGLVHAQDRLWQMEVNRRAVQGRLSALFGRRTVALDRLAKTLDLYGHAKRAVAHQTPEAQAALEAYAAGVNAWIRHIDARSLGRGAPEFFLFGKGFAPWTPADSLGILKMMALRLSDGARSEVRRARFQLALPAARVADILPDYPGPAETVVPRYSTLFPELRHADTRLAPPPPEPGPLLAALGPPAPGKGGASNAWAVDASRSSSRAPLLANDPHLWLSAPGVWYLADLRGGDLAGIGATLPGVPAILIGHNGRLGWGLTTANVDDQDLFIEKLNPADPESYLTPEGWRDFETRQIRIEIDGSAPLVETVRRTRHGPVLAGEMFGAEAVTPEGHVAALAWTALTDEDTGLSALIRLLEADSVAQGLAIAPMVAAPAQVVTLADASEVAMVVAGRVPLRQPDNPVRGRLPSPGWKSVHDWQGFLPPEEIPVVRAPEEGAIAAANNRITDAAYPRHLGHDWAAPYRIRRIRKELSGRRFHSRDSFVALQADAVSEMARSVLPLIARDLWWREPVSTQEGLRGEALALLAEWNGEMDQHSPEPLIFSEWMRRLTHRLAADELGGLFREVAGPRPLFVERVFRNIEGAAIWCDVDKTPEPETCREIAAAALDDALADLARTHGRNIAGWRWGEVHRAVHRHMPLGFSDWLGLMVNIEQETSGGSHTLMRGLSAGRGPRPFENIHAAGVRVVYDFADLDRSVWVLSTGQSGHPFSRWYDHMSELWARGDVVPMSMDDEDAQSGAVGIMEITPEKG